MRTPFEVAELRFHRAYAAFEKVKAALRVAQATEADIVAAEIDVLETAPIYAAALQNMAQRVLDWCETIRNDADRHLAEGHKKG